MRTLCAILIALCATTPAYAQDCEFGTFGCGHDAMHDRYRGWTAPYSIKDCCGHQDCRPILSRFNDRIGLYQIWIPEFGRWENVPPEVVDKPDKFGDGHAHACTSPPSLVMNSYNPLFYVFCFSPTGSKG